MNTTQEDLERMATMMQLTKFVMKSAIAFLLPVGETLLTLGFEDVLLAGINDDAVVAAFDTPEKLEIFKKTCLAIAADLGQIVGGEDA